LQVYVNGQPLDLVPGMTVRHALVAADLLITLAQGRKVYDDWGNELGLDGAVLPEMRLWVR